MNDFEQGIARADLNVAENEVAPSHELAGLRSASEAWFFKLFIAGNHPDVRLENISSRDDRFSEDFVQIYTGDVRHWFTRWWEHETADAVQTSISAVDEPRAIAERAYTAYKTSSH
jgi:hypothetical protein